MRKKAGLMLIVIGTVLILLALSLFLYNRREAQQAGDVAEQTAQTLICMIEQQTEAEESQSAESTQQDEEEEVPFATMTAVQVDGEWYIGVLSIPELGLELPVMEDWSYAGLKVAPCRYSGSLAGGNLVICAHNYERHFGNLKYLSLGSTVTFTTMDGTVYTYQVTQLTTIQPTAIDELMDGDWDLSLYTCTIGGKTRVVVRCALVG